MKAERWDELLVLFERAIALPPGQRLSFASDACCEDDELRGELESLLRHDAEAPPDFMRPPKPPPGFDKIFETLSRISGTSPGSLPIPASSSERSLPRPPNIPDYEIVKLVGEGGFGRVWLGKQRLTGVLYAIKTILKDRIGRVEIEGIRQYKQRAATHANLIRLEHVGETPQQFYYIMELADDSRGPGVHAHDGYEPMSLKDHLNRRRAFPEVEAVTIVVAVLDALEHLHNAGLLHRDVKPANILLLEGTWKLGDLGLVSRSLDSHSKAGTPAYCPPEGVVDASGDLFSLGRLLAELLTGRIPRDLEKDLNQKALSKRARRLLPVIRRACSVEPEARYQEARFLRRDMLAALKGHTVRAASISVGIIGLVAAALWTFAGTRTGQSTVENPTLNSQTSELLRPILPSLEVIRPHCIGLSEAPRVGEEFMLTIGPERDGWFYLLFATPRSGVEFVEFQDSKGDDCPTRRFGIRDNAEVTKFRFDEGPGRYTLLLLLTSEQLSASTCERFRNALNSEIRKLDSIQTEFPKAYTRALHSAGAAEAVVDYETIQYSVGSS